VTDLDRIVPLDTDGSGTPLYCLHASSGSAYSYLGLAQLLDRPVYGVEAPGFDGDREPVRSLADLSAEYVDVLHERSPGGPYLLLGWSVGGLLALDMARRLTESGDAVPLVVMVDVSVPDGTPLPPEKEIVRRFLHEILASMGASAPDTVLAGRPDDADPGELLAAAAGELPPELDAELLSERYAVFRALVEASYGHRVTRPYGGPVVHVRASESRLPPLAWSPLVPDLTEHTVTGTHHSIWSGETLPELAKVIDAELRSWPAPE
jgi:thioesterase domain-containing protein